MSSLPNLPRGWEWATVREVGEVKLGRQRSPEHHDGPNMRPYLRVANVYDARLDLTDVLKMNFTPSEFETFQLRPGDVLINEGQSLEWVGRSAIYRGEVPGACFQNTLIRFRAKPLILPEFALLVFRHYVFSQRFRRVAKWTTNIAHLGAERFAEVEFPVPPMNEQRRIVAEADKQLTRLDAGVEALRRVQVQLKRYRASVLNAACEGLLVPTEAELARREKRDYEPSDRVLARNKMEIAVLGTESVPLPEGWCWTTIARTIEVIDYRGRTPPYSEAGIPHLRSSNVRDGRIVWENLRFVTQATYDQYMTRGIPRVGDLLFSTEAPLGELAPVPDAPFSLAQRLMVLRPDQRVWNAAFLMYQMMSPSFRARLTQRGTGSTVTGVSSRNFQPLPLAVPPLAEQRRIVSEVEARLSAISAAASTIDASLRRAGSLRYSVLKAAFEGSLVPQNPRDEPASKLLERISAAVENKPLPKQGRAKQATAVPKMKKATR